MEDIIEDMAINDEGHGVNNMAVEWQQGNEVVDANEQQVQNPEQQ